MTESNQKKKKTKLRWLIKTLLLIVIIFVAMPAITVGSLNYVEQPKFCGICHTMEPYYDSWAKSGHSEISCYNCHADIKVQKENDETVNTDKDIIPRYMLTSNKVVRVFGKAVEDASKYGEVAGNYIGKKQKQLGVLYTAATASSDQINKNQIWDRCLNCHGDLLFSETGNDHYGHFKHAGSGIISCKECHGDLVHGEKLKVTRQQCLECHDEKIEKPSSHLVDSFKITHGKEYLANNSCNLCHVKGSKEPLCQNCHKVQMPHPEEYKKQHIEAIPKIGTRNCFNCHETKTGLESDERGQPEGAASCRVCHGKEMPHTNNILKEHTILTKEEGIKSCNNCHQTASAQKDMAIACNDCHGLQMPHPQDFRNKHKETYYAKGQAVCNLCHSPMNRINPGAPWANPNFCSSCHIRNKPHKSGYKIQHQIGGYDRKSCNFCHPTQIHCTQCHFGE